MLSASEVKKHVKKTLETIPIGKEPNQIQGAKEFYKYMFSHHPDLRKYFKGAENYSADDVQKSERFDKQGQRLQLAMYILADTFDDEATFRAYARETVNRHRQFRMTPDLWGVSGALKLFLNEYSDV
ncbi:Intracellular globin [Trichostrongylus colubriformis]|uniref:Intracellular globin n=1 Tax=Trichostrongylus colubriformis TaxID=6319 RepID=A0AAN8IJE5_TRICO